MLDSPYHTEKIPPEHKLHLRVNISRCRRNGVKALITPSAVKPIGSDGLSTDWCKYSTCIQAKNRGKKPRDNGIISVIAGNVKSIRGLDVRHDPIFDDEIDNQSHSLITGIPPEDDNDPEIVIENARVRGELLRIFMVCINPDDFPEFMFQHDN